MDQTPNELRYTGPEDDDDVIHGLLARSRRINQKHVESGVTAHELMVTEADLEHLQTHLRYLRRSVRHGATTNRASFEFFKGEIDKLYDLAFTKTEDQ